MKLEAIHRAKSTKMFDDLLGRFEYQTKRTRSEKILPNHDFEDEDFMNNRSVSKIRLYYFSYLVFLISLRSGLRRKKRKKLTSLLRLQFLANTNLNFFQFLLYYYFHDLYSFT